MDTFTSCEGCGQAAASSPWKPGVRCDGGNETDATLDPAAPWGAGLGFLRDQQVEAASGSVTSLCSGVQSSSFRYAAATHTHRLHL